MWQKYWRRMAQIAPIHYTVPKGVVGRRFLTVLTHEFRTARVARTTNSEKPLVFAAVILPRTTGVWSAKDIRLRMNQRMDLWQQGNYAALVDDMEAEALARIGTPPEPTEETCARAFNARVLSGRLRAAVRNLTNRDGGGVLRPDDKCMKTGRPVLEVLQEKHPKLRDPPLDTDDENGAFETYEEGAPAIVPVDITANTIESIATKLSGGAGLGGMDAVDLRNWLLRYGAESQALREEMAQWTMWLANESPPWAAYRALMAGRLVALDKQPGVRPVGIGEIYRRLMAKCLLVRTGHTATAACDNLNLCAGLPAGIEGAVHAMGDAWSAAEKRGGHVTRKPADPAPTRDKSLTTDVTAAEAYATLLVDARNGFNELSRKAALWTVRHRWPGGSRFAFNCYWHVAQLVI